MPIINLSDNFSVSGEPQKNELSQLMANGLTTLINVRPDDESADQKNSQEWQALCRSLDIRYHYLPVKSGSYSAAEVASFKKLLQQSQGPVHGFCRTGTRATHLWAISQKDQLSFAQLQQKCLAKGYDLKEIYCYFK